MLKRPTPKVGERQFRAAEVEKADSTTRSIRFVASDETVDRYGDIIRASGWQLGNFAKNGPLLFGHQSREPAIGTATAWVDGTRLMADATLWPEGVSEFADVLWRIYEAGGNRAVSVGFLPTVEPKLLRAEPDADGYAAITGFEFIGQELLELSIVPVPANPAALAVARSLADERTVRRLFTRDPSAFAQVAAEQRRRSITLARLRAG